MGIADDGSNGHCFEAESIIRQCVEAMGQDYGTSGTRHVTIIAIRADAMMDMEKAS